MDINCILMFKIIINAFQMDIIHLFQKDFISNLIYYFNV